MDSLFTDPLEDARAWKAANPTAYAAIVRWAFDDRDHGVRPAIDLYANLLRRPHFAERLGMVPTTKKYLLNNNVHASLAHLVMLDYPQVEFETRTAKSDD